jgi:hypothetical protein
MTFAIRAIARTKAAVLRWAASEVERGELPGEAIEFIQAPRA